MFSPSSSELEHGQQNCTGSLELSRNSLLIDESLLWCCLTLSHRRFLKWFPSEDNKVFGQLTNIGFKHIHQSSIDWGWPLMSSSLTFASLWFQQQAPESILPRVLLKTPSHNFSGLHRRSCFCHRRDHASDTPSIWKTNTLRRPLPTPSGTSKWSCSSLLTLLLLAY